MKMVDRGDMKLKERIVLAKKDIRLDRQSVPVSSLRPLPGSLALARSVPGSDLSRQLRRK